MRRHPSPWVLAATAVLIVPVALVVSAVLTPLPPALKSETAESVRILDRSGRLIQEVRGDERWAASAGMNELPKELTAALICAEDARFFAHPGIDPLAILRAGAQLVQRGRIVSGASTLTQQLARNLVPRPRTFWGKWNEMALALRLEASLGKSAILREYMNRVHFGPSARGVAAASELFFDKPVARLSLAESATLAAMPRGPSFYDPRRGIERVRARRDWILRRLGELGQVEPQEIARALAEPVSLHPKLVEGGAHHLVRLVATTEHVRKTESPERRHEIRSTVNLDLQRDVEVLTARTIGELSNYDASSAAVLVVDNASADVLAYVGSPDFFSEMALGQNDGARALRQPGSTLKPFIYARAMETRRYTAATILPDVEVHIPTPRGDYCPRNYDGRYHGPVRLREALGNSLNVPAVYVAQRLGVEDVLGTLHQFGFSSLDEPASHYGAAIALGDGEVRLDELAAAYATLARGGTYMPLHYELDHGKRARSVRVLSATTAWLVTDVLSDAGARLGAFGRNGPLHFPFPVAVKTGTSKGYRDNWTIGYTAAVTVAVWVGNFDGHPMRGSSGVTGAAPLFHDVMLAATRHATEGGAAAEAPLRRSREVSVDEALICSLSGERAGQHCPHRIVEHFARGTTPTSTCAMHVAMPCVGCEGGSAVFERYSEAFAGWAMGARRPVAPRGSDYVARERPPSPVIAFPFDGAEFVRDEAIPSSQQSIVLQARAPDDAHYVRFVLDGARLARTDALFSVNWPLERGQHVLHAETERGVQGPTVRFAVR